MSAVLNYRIYEGLNRVEMRASWACDVIEAFEDGCDEAGSWDDEFPNYSGDIGELTPTVGEWNDARFPSLEEAENWLGENHAKWEPAIAVSFLDKKGEPAWLIGGWCAD